MEIHAASYIGYRRKTIYKPVVALLFSVVPYVWNMKYAYTSLQFVNMSIYIYAKHATDQVIQMQFFFF